MRARLLIALVLVGSSAPAHSETRTTVRFGVLPLDLRSSSDTPFFGGEIDRAVSAYNAAATAYDRMHGGRTERLDSGDLGVATKLFTISPGIELGVGPYFFRLELPIGFADDLHTFGVAVYPLDLEKRLGNTTVYVSAGGAASYLDRAGTGDVGALVTARVAAGARFSHVMIELGYNAFVIGGSVDPSQLDAMAAQFGSGPPPRPGAAIAAGEAKGIVDVSIGVTF